MTAFFVEYSVSEVLPPRNAEAVISRLRYRTPAGVASWSDGRSCLHVGVDRRRSRNFREVQPKIAASGTLTVFDGFLVERSLLVKKLITNGQAISLDSPDVDLVSAGYEAFGRAAPAHFSGDFSFVVLDPRDGSVFGARDPFGRRALFYARCRNSWILSNELPALLEHPECSQDYSREALADFLLFGWHDLFEKSLTPFRSIQSVAPGCHVTISGTAVREGRYWCFPEAQSDRRLGPRDYVDELRFQLGRAVSDRIDCSSVVVSMSGGLDSTAIAALAREAMESRGGLGEIFLETNVHEGGGEDERFARMAGEHLGMRHRIRVHSLDPAFDPWPPTWSPHRQIAPISILEHDRHLSGDADVRLVGSAADSLFAHDVATFLGTVSTYGLRSALTSRKELKRMFGISMSWGTGVLSRSRAPFSKGKSRTNPVWSFPEWLQPDLIRELSLRERWEHFWNWEPRVTRMRPHPSIEKWLGWPSWFCGNMFVGVDYCPAEVVDPFLDLGLLRCVMSIPSEPWLRDKRLLRMAMSDLLPAAVVNRPKTIAGDVFKDPLARIPHANISDWTAEPGLDEYIVRSAVPRFAPESNPAERLAQLHPFFLNQWLRSRQQW